MRARNILTLGFFLLPAFAARTFSYPPAVCILGKAKSCLACHVNNGPWTNEQKTIIDILDKETMKSLRQADYSLIFNRAKQSSPVRRRWLRPIQLEMVMDKVALSS